MESSVILESTKLMMNEMVMILYGSNRKKYSVFMILTYS